MKNKVLSVLLIVLSFFQMNAQKSDTLLFRFCNDNYECGYFGKNGACPPTGTGEKSVKTSLQSLKNALKNGACPFKTA